MEQYNSQQEALNALLKSYGVNTEDALLTKLGGDTNKLNQILGRISSTDDTVFTIDNPNTTNPTNPYNGISTVSDYDAKMNELKLDNVQQSVDYNKIKLDPNYNSITGLNSYDDTAFYTGDATSSGILKPIAGVAQAGFNGYMAYQSLQEQRKNNKSNLAIARENARRQAITQNNEINQKNRYAGLLLGNSNSYGATLGTVTANPYMKF